MRRLFLSLCAVLVSGQAMALSCLPADPLQDYLDARDSEDGYRVVLGTLAMPKTVPVRDHSDVNRPKPKVLRTKGRVIGDQLSGKGFKVPMDAEVSVVTTCAAAWCSDFPQSQRGALMFIKDTGKSMEITLGPCPGGFYSQVRAKDIKRIERCHKGGSCRVRKP